MREGDEITVEKDQEEFNGVIYEVSSMADTESGLFNVKARLDQEPDWETLPTGSKVKLYVTSESVENVMLVPVDSVYYDGGLSYVYTYNEEEGTLHKEQVETGLYDSQWIEIQSGLDETDIVLTTWSSELYEGTYVRTVESGNTADDETTAESGGTEAEEKEEELTETPEAEEQQ